MQFINNLWNNNAGIDPSTTIFQMAHQYPDLVITTQKDIMTTAYVLCGISGTIGVLMGIGIMAAVIYLVKKKQAQATMAEVERQQGE